MPGLACGCYPALCMGLGVVACCGGGCNVILPPLILCYIAPPPPALPELTYSCPPSLIRRDGIRAIEVTLNTLCEEVLPQRYVEVVSP